MDHQLPAEWFAPLFTAEAMRRVFSDHGRLQGILDFEAALARAEARAGMIPTAAADAIASRCRAQLFNLDALAQTTAVAGNSAIPVIQELTQFVAAQNSEAAGYVHWGATSQDAMDTGLVLQIRQALDLMLSDLHALGSASMKLAVEHKETHIAGRTWLQHAAPTTFGLKVVGWLSAVVRHVERFRALQPRISLLQFGGATGTLAAFGADADRVTSFLAEELRLQPAEMPWHAQRDRVAEVATTVGLLVGTLGKMARDLSLMSQTEIAEVAEPSAPGRGGSSSMPQKRNPVGCATILATATRVPALVSIMLSAMPQEHERGLGGWHAEWETLPEIFLLASGALAQMRYIIENLQVDAARMKSNLEITRGLIYAESVSTALARAIGRSAAHTAVEATCRKAQTAGLHLREVLLTDAEITAHLSATEIKALFDPQPHIEAAARFVDQALTSTRAILMASSQETSR